jgi:hypothetical protein
MNTMNTPTATSQPRKAGLPLRHIDPILQEVYDLKAQLNKEAGYSVRNILERVKQSPRPILQAP